MNVGATGTVVAEGRSREAVGRLADQIASGHSIAMAPDYSGCAAAVVAELIRRQYRDLTLIGVPQLGLLADLLIGAGCVTDIEAAAVTLGEFGQAPRFTDAIQRGDVAIRDSTCPVIHAGLMAAEKGIPFMPLRGILGSDLVTYRQDWRVIDNPFHDATPEDGGTDPILLVPAIRPDVALFHAPLTDADGNVWIGVRRELLLMAHASATCLVTAEAMSAQSLLGDPRQAAGTIPSLYVTDVEVVPQGAWPIGLFTCYPPAGDVIAQYTRSATTQSGFDAYLKWFLDRQNG